MIDYLPYYQEIPVVPVQSSIQEVTTQRPSTKHSSSSKLSRESHPKRSYSIDSAVTTDSVIVNHISISEEEYDEEEHFYNTIREDINHVNKKYSRCLENCEQYLSDSTQLENVYRIE